MAATHRRTPTIGTPQTRLRIAPFVLLSFFLLLLAVGIALDEPARVLEQAKSICLACIGIG